MSALVAAVDVGTASARAGIFDATGRLLGRAETSIETFRTATGGSEQDSTQIWSAVASALRAARDEAAAAPEAVSALAFDATCSLVVRDRDGRPVAVSESGPDRRDTILWLDHRAEAEAALASATAHPVLAEHGGNLSPEMQIPKLMWLKRHLPSAWARSARIMDLTDFLAWAATGTAARSACTLAAKWAYRAHLADPWPSDFHAATGLTDLFDRTGLPARAVPVGTDLGPLAPAAAAQVGLSPSCRVAAGLVDAHAGALGSLGAHARDPAALERHLALVAGTSTCVMALSPDPCPLPGFWGPHLDAILPGLWLLEGGQSASGALLDHVCRLWSGGAEPTPGLHARVVARIAEMQADHGTDLAPRLHVLPDFMGNRTPFADPAARGVLSGLDLDASFDGLARVYWRTAVGLALGLRQILDRLAEAGFASDTLHLSGGHARSPLLTALYADATGRSIVTTDAPDAVLLGTAMVAAAGAGLAPDLASAAVAMHQPGRTRRPDREAVARFDRDRDVFLAMQRHRIEIEGMLDA